ncbi:MAG: extracellular solute-binding protein [Alphaproteobacteria bacterium]|nr:extracellular solute-binding protein [Alphaproteobacteria bacterium]
MVTDRETLAKQALAEGRRLRDELTRRRMLELSAATAAAAWVGGNIAEARAAGEETHGPGWYTDDKLTGKVVMYTFAGQRWGLPPKAMLPTFKERFPNVEVEVVDEPVGEAYGKIQMRAASKSDAFNTQWADHNQLSALVNIGAMVDMDPWLAKDPGWTEDYFKDVPANVTVGYRSPQTPEGHTYMLASDSNAKLQYYRKDLFEKAGIKGPATTFEEAIEIAKELHAPDRDQYGFVTTARRGLFAGLELYQMVRSYGGVWFNDQWEPQFNTEIGHRAFSTLLKLMEYRHPVTINAADDEVNAVLAKGSAVFAPFEWGTSVLNNKDFTEFASVFGAAVVPKGETPESKHEPLMGGFGQYVNAFAKDQDAAFEFIKHMNSGDYTDSRIGLDYVMNTGQPARSSLLRKYADVNPYFIALADSIVVCTPAFPWIPEAFTVAEALGNDVVAVIAGEKDMETALKDIDAAQRQIMAESGYYD